jgi:hypothetical protein
MSLLAQAHYYLIATEWCSPHSLSFNFDFMSSPDCKRTASEEKFKMIFRNYL